jgi:hypothetical protein
MNLPERNRVLHTRLKSNSVILKYDSENSLYYFQHLIPWVHYIAVYDDKYLDDFMKIKVDDDFFKDYI